ncbi:MAG: polysaccharide deacetylase family protein [Bradyrhizobium sp.]
MYRRLTERDFSRRFACFTFDDGYRDNRDFALPVMREFDAPFTVYVASDFAGRYRPSLVDRTGDGDRQDRLDRSRHRRPDRPPRYQHAGRQGAAFNRLHDWLRGLPGAGDSQREVSALCARYGVDETAISRELCMSWDELKPFAEDPLIGIGAHTITHCNLAKQSREIAGQEMTVSRQRIEDALQKRCFISLIPMATRSRPARANSPWRKRPDQDRGHHTPGHDLPESAGYLTALPRVSLNGNYQDTRILPVLTSGAATAMWNGFRRIDAA